MRKILLSLATVCILFCAFKVYYNNDQYIDHHPYEADGVISTQSERSHRWVTVRKQYLKLQPVCEACGTNQDLNVHHIIPFNVDPSKELDLKNLITLCRTHHFKFGHYCGGGKSNWAECANPNVRADAQKHRRSLSKL